MLCTAHWRAFFFKAMIWTSETRDRQASINRTKNDSCKKHAHSKKFSLYPSLNCLKSVFYQTQITDEQRMATSCHSHTTDLDLFGDLNLLFPILHYFSISTLCGVWGQTIAIWSSLLSSIPSWTNTLSAGSLYELILSWSCLRPKIKNI